MPSTQTAPQRKQSLRARLSTPTWVFWLMFGINVVNYLDRLLAVAVGPTLKVQFHLTDRDIGLLSSAFLLLYTLATLPLGMLADRLARARIVAAGVALWSIASATTAVVRGFGGLFLSRVGVGIGEASYFPAGTALLSAYHPLERRARVMSRWGAGQLVGAAVAFGLSALLDAWLGAARGWRIAFLVAALPGLGLAALMWFVADAPPPQSPPLAEQIASPRPRQPLTAHLGRAASHVLAQTRIVLGIPTIWVGIVLQALTYIVVTPTVTFLPIYLRSSRHVFTLSASETSLVSGIILIAGGISGVLLGGEVASWLSRRTPGGRILAVSAGFGLGLPCFVVMLLARSLPLFLVAGILTVLVMNIPAGPLAAVVQDATPPRLRASAVAIGLMLSHLLGDAWAPATVGILSTALGEHTGTALLIIAVPALLVATVVGFFGAGVYARDLAAREREAQTAR